MEVKTFDLSKQLIPNAISGWQVLSVRTLQAYAISYAMLECNGIAYPVDEATVRVVGDTLECQLSFNLDQNDKLALRIYYHGIRDYKLLFPVVQATDPDRASRLGAFYEEAEKNFASGAWLSFMLMCAAMFEHLLYFRLGFPARQTSLKDVSTEALNRSEINQAEFDIVNKARTFRNVIHCNRLQDSYVSRRDAMDAKILIERLILRL